VDFLAPKPECDGYKTGTVEYTPEFAAKLRRYFQQRRLSKEPLPPEEPLQSVRKLRRRSQSEVAAAMGTTQSEISSLERRDDALISTLAGYIEALGGTLDLVARFPGLHIRFRLGRSA
jgi:hypothetical protein